MTIDHIGLGVTDVPRSLAFYTRALAPLGLVVVASGEGYAGFGAGSRGEFWLGGGGPGATPVHIAFLAQGRAAVRDFHQAALAAGGTDNGGPGLRPDYSANYYAAFVLDPDGHNVEAVCHAPEAQ